MVAAIAMRRASDTLDQRSIKLFWDGPAASLMEAV
jgi:hypothetical protein